MSADSYVKPHIVQRLLSTTADVIANKIMTNPALGISLPSNNSLLYPSRRQNTAALPVIAAENLSKEEAQTMLHRQHDLLSSTIVPDGESAKEIFADNTTNESKNFKYTLGHNIILPIRRDVLNDNSPVDLYYFNIDRANREVNISGDGKFFINKIAIKNKSKDAFTARSNYQVTISLAFKFFEDLTRDNITLYKVGDPNSTITLPLLSIIYRYFKIPGNPNPTTDVFRDRRDPEGIYLNQVLKFENLVNDNTFEHTRQTLADELHRTFHLTYYKHEFSVFRSEDPLLKEFENELTIDFVSYEADLVTDLEKKKKENVPTLLQNLYTLLLDVKAGSSAEYLTVNAYGYNTDFKSFSGDLKSAYNLIEALKNGLAVLRRQLSCKIIYDKKSASSDQRERKEANDYAAYRYIDPDEVKEKIKNTREAMLTAKYEIQRHLVNSILALTTVYELETTYDVLDDYVTVEFWNDFTEKFSIGTAVTTTLMGAQAGGTYATFAGGTAAGAVVGGAVGLTGYAATVAYDALQGHYTSVKRTEAEIQSIRNRILGAGTIKKLGTSDLVHLIEIGNAIAGGTINNIIDGNGNITSQTIKNASGWQKFNLFTGLGGMAANQIIWTADQVKAYFRGFQAKTGLERKTLESVGLIETVKADDIAQTFDTIIKVPFILFGDIIKMLNIADPDSMMLIGGKLIDNFTVSKEYSYVNYFTYPISLTMYLKFLKDFILEPDRDLRYNTEVFLKDAFENLLKKTVMSSENSILQMYKNYVPTRLEMSVTVHQEDNNFNTLFNAIRGNFVPVSDPDYFKEIKTRLGRSRNINFTQPMNRLKKVYVLASDEDLKKYNFYEEYKKWVATENTKRVANSLPTLSSTNFCSLGFQEYINSEHWIPCSLIRNTSLYETIVKKKNMSFKRMDNPNLTTGNIIDNASFMRLPYQFSGDFQAYMSFFLDTGGLMFVSPPATKEGATNNQFGFSGLYVVKSSNFEYSFQKLVTNNITLPNEQATYNIEAYMVSYGDAMTLEKENRDKSSDCTDPLLASTDPVSLQRLDIARGAVRIW
jgi:hypothetical protein